MQTATAKLLAIEDRHTRGPRSLALDVFGANSNVRLQIGDVTGQIGVNLPPRVSDLIEVASYIYVADQAFGRGGKTLESKQKSWRRQIRLKMPVRDLAFWKDADAHRVLTETLDFLSGDEWKFEFEALDPLPTTAPYFDFKGCDQTGINPEEVVLFSGGLDSLAGVIQEMKAGRKLALVSHSSGNKLRACQDILANRLQADPDLPKLLRVAVTINKDQDISNEYTQRSRSFLYGAIGFTVARSLGLSRIRFYENGIMSLNLPPAEQFVGSRDTRTTHPRTLAGFAQLFSLVCDSAFIVENPFLLKTKTEVVRLIRDSGYSHLIKDSTSCAHAWLWKADTRHCGECSQCIDRRISILAAGAQNEDAKYGAELFTSERKDESQRIILNTYVMQAKQIRGLKSWEFAHEYPELLDSFPYLGKEGKAVLSGLIEAHRRHANDVDAALKIGIEENRETFKTGTLPSSCLVSMLLGEAKQQQQAVTLHPETMQKSAAVIEEDPNPLPETARKLIKEIRLQYPNKVPSEMQYRLYVACNSDMALFRVAATCNIGISPKTFARWRVAVNASERAEDSGI